MTVSGASLVPASGADTLIDRRLAVCVGTGGVGKTTVAAALAAVAARRGRRALVLTIDPARRLADALGMRELSNDPSELPEAARRELGIEGSGTLAAVMLDMKSTFDSLVERFAESDEARDRILSNPIYQHVSDALAGSAEYAAMEKVYELAESGDWDLVVVDTPPSQHALDFLEAPQRLLEFLDSRIVQVLLHPAFAAGRLSFRLFQRGIHRVLQVLERVSGLSFLEDVSEFLLAFEGMSEGFRQRAGRVRRMLLGPDSAYLLIAGCSPAATRAAREFLDTLERQSVPMWGVVANRVHRWPAEAGAEQGEAPRALLAEDELERERRLLAAGLSRQQPAPADPEDAAGAAIEAARRYARWVEREQIDLAPLRADVARRGLGYCEVPELPADVHDLAGLKAIGAHLTRAAQPAPASEENVAHGKR